MSQAKSDQKQKHKRFCGHCRNHGYKFEIRGHKRNCKYKFCSCQKCKIQEYANMLSVDERKCQREQEGFKNVQKIDKIKDDDEKFFGNFGAIGNKKLEFDDNLMSETKSELKNVYEFQDDDDCDEQLPPFQSVKKSTQKSEIGRNSDELDELTSFCKNLSDDWMSCDFSFSFDNDFF
ncbi:unnamed protein product [Chironomus riparius]|uniref:DM domain-containing protein n=1 Tax=Chironomus riparius TaxID=315576 RepID=A0A9N9S6E0_9DIPT|nr:unnamed protein product [Chironomus riparius]